MDTTPAKNNKLGIVSGVYIPVLLSIISILMFLRFGTILGQVGLVGMLGLLVIAYAVDLITALSLSAIASNGEVKGGGAYYLISRSLGPEFGGSIGVLFYLSQVMNTALNVVGLVDCLKLNVPSAVPHGYWESYGLETAVLVACTGLCLAGSAIFARANGALLFVIMIATLSIPVSSIVRQPFNEAGVHFTGLSFETLSSNLLPRTTNPRFHGLDTFRELFGLIFPATSGIFAGASMSGDLKNPSKSIPKGTLWAMFSTFILYVLVILSLASSITHGSFLRRPNVIAATNLSIPLILAGECATTFFSALMGLVGAAKLLQALARDRIIPGLAIFGQGTKQADDPIFAVLLTYCLAQLALFANLNQIATLIATGYQMTFLVMNLACFLLKIGSAPNFRPAFKFFSWQTALAGSLLSIAAMFFIDETYAASAICLLLFLFLLIHYASPPKHWGDVSQNLIYHQVRKYLLRLKPEHIKFWRPQIILLINDPRHHTRLIRFCNSLKKGSLYILGHVIVTDDFARGIDEAKLQQTAWTKYITEYSRIKAFVQLTMSPTIVWGVRNLVLSAGLGGMRPNIAVIGFYNMSEMQRSLPSATITTASASAAEAKSAQKVGTKATKRRRADTSARLLGGQLPTDGIRTEGMMSPCSYLTIIEDLALRHRLNLAIGKGFENLESPRPKGQNTKKYVDLWPIQMSAEIAAEGNPVFTTNFDTYTLILQLGHILLTVPTWRTAFRLRILVFVEYEHEVPDQEARMKALLEKLRIEADILVLCLATGNLRCYETIVNGRTEFPETEGVIDELLKEDEWWDELKEYRKEFDEPLPPVEVRQSISRLRRSSNIQFEAEEDVSRRLSVQEMLEFPRNPAVSKISKLGGNFGLHTQHLTPDIDDAADSLYSTDEDGGEIAVAAEPYFDDVASTTSADDVVEIASTRRRSFGGLHLLSTPLQNPVTDNKALPAVKRGYGTMASAQRRATPAAAAEVSTSSLQQPPAGNLKVKPATTELKVTTSLLSAPKEDQESPVLTLTTSPANLEPKPPDTPGGDTAQRRPTRPGLHSRASSYSGIDKPLSRSGSTVRFSSRPVPETTLENQDGYGPRLTFAEPKAGPSEPLQRSGEDSAVPRSATANSDFQVNVPELLKSYSFGKRGDTEDGSESPSQDVPLSFNDLPSRAQFIILNDLMRHHSNETAVMLTTLPIPEEGTCENEADSLRYLSDLEILCEALPPVLLILSNNMTVTVSL